MEWPLPRDGGPPRLCPGGVVPQGQRANAVTVLASNHQKSPFVASNATNMSKKHRPQFFLAQTKMSVLPPPPPPPCNLPPFVRPVPPQWAASRSTKRSTHARPGMHMQQCSAVPLIRWFHKHLSVCTGCTDMCHVTLLSGRVLSAITSSLHVTILGFEVYRRLDRLAVCCHVVPQHS